MVAHSDDKLDAMEKKVLKECAAQVGVRSNQIETIIQETKTRLAAFKKGVFEGPMRKRRPNPPGRWRPFVDDW